MGPNRVEQAHQGPTRPNGANRGHMEQNGANIGPNRAIFLRVVTILGPKDSEHPRDCDHLRDGYFA